jgi:hypothetical protein
MFLQQKKYYFYYLLLSQSIKITNFYLIPRLVKGKIFIKVIRFNLYLLVHFFFLVFLILSIFPTLIKKIPKKRKFNKSLRGFFIEIR